MPDVIPVITVNTARLRELRTARGWTHKQVAEALGYGSSVGYVYIENGRNRPDAARIATLAWLYQVPLESLFLYGSK